ncbi:MAG: outer membrane beta-barrel protein [Novosphingobium sp.]
MLERQAGRDLEQGVELGGILVLPVVTARATYDSNVFAAPDGQDDAIGTLAASVAGVIDGSVVNGRLNADISRSFYSRFESEGSTQGGASAQGTVQLPSDFQVTSLLSYEHRIEPRTSSGAPILAGRPVRYDAGIADVDLSWQGPLLRATIGGRVARFDYDGSGLGSTSFDRRVRDYTYTEVRGRLDYAIDSERQVFVTIDRHAGNYRLPDPGTGLNRDSDGWKAVAGLLSTITPLLRGWVSVGVLHESSDSAVVRPVTTLALNAALDFLATPLTTVHLDASRRLENSASLDASGYIASHLLMRVDHEFSPNTLADIGLTYDGADFRTTDRNDRLIGVEAGVRHQWTAALSTQLRGTYQNRSSDGSDRVFDFDRATASISVSHQF